MSDLRKTFERFDRDGSGYIEIRELEALLEGLGVARGDDAVLGAMAQLRTASPGRISWDELRAWWDGPGSRAAASRPARSEAAQEIASPIEDEEPTEPRGTRPKLSEADVRKVFDGFDRDGNGEIDRRELARMLEAAGLDPDDAEVGATMRRYDTDRSGRLSWDEFLRLWAEL
jgi:Ca2+-binding EF-hand superfamily protein